MEWWGSVAVDNQSHCTAWKAASSRSQTALSSWISVSSLSPHSSSLLSSRASIPLSPSLPSAAGCSRTGFNSAVRGGRLQPPLPGAELAVQRRRRTDQASRVGQCNGPPTGLGWDIQPELQAGHWYQHHGPGQRRGAHLRGSPCRWHKKGQHHRQRRW